MTQEEEEEDLLPHNKLIVKACDIAGIDEVGRGAVFGPVFAGAVILDKRSENFLIKNGLKDSKKLSHKARASLIPLIKTSALAWSLGQASAKEIDSIGIRASTEKAMLRAIHKIPFPPKLLLVDGILPLKEWKGMQQTIKHGEDHFPSIAAASVLAKEARDGLIKRLSKEFPGFGLDQNVGYGTQLHYQSLKKLGITKLHRQSFLSKCCL